MKFSAFNLDNKLINALSTLGYINLTPIQERVIPKAIKGKSLICKSQTGSGKTHAFLIPAFTRIEKELNKIQVLIISPTNELARQTYNFARDIDTLYNNYGVKLLSINNELEDDISSLDFSTNVPKMVIGTPGRIIDVIIKQKNVDKTGIKIIVLDECDMLLDESHISDIKEILFSIRPEQRLIFTATMKEHMIQDTYKFIGADQIINIDSNKVNVGVRHHLVNIKHVNYLESLINFLNINNPYFTLVFASENTQVEKIYKELNALGIKCALINGEIDARERKIVMKRIRQGEFNLIICSDIASRGIDLDNVSTVISINLPTDLDYYYHRAGRCGRNNKIGDSYIFYDEDKMEQVNKLIQKNRNINFDYYILKKDSMKKVETPNGKKLIKNEVLEKEIKKEISKVRTNKVKPGYKKKIKNAIQKAKDNHKKQIIKKNLREKRKQNSNLGGYGSN